jgi:mono/diheme cytochrome c family protein
MTLMQRVLTCSLAAIAATAATTALAADAAPAGSARSADAKAIEHGRYLVQIAGCNDCHTAGYAPAGGKVPEQEWLKGDALGWRGPWGTTYPANLRRFMQGVTEDQWLKYARTTELRPPMPWFGLRVMTDRDLRAIYRYVRSLGPAGDPAPAYVPPNQTPTGPYVQWPSAPK